MSSLNNHVSATVESLKMLNSRPGEFSKKMDSERWSSLAPFNISHSPDAKLRFQREVQKPFIEALVNNIEERLPNTGVFAEFDLLDPSKLPDTPEVAMDMSYGESEVHQLGEFYSVGDTSIVNAEDLKSEWLDLGVYILSTAHP